METLLLHAGSLNPGTVGEPRPHIPGVLVYPMTGAYVVSKIGYTSDPSGTVVGGWRSVYLEPVRGPESANA